MLHEATLPPLVNVKLMPRKQIFLCTIGLVSGHAVTAVILQFAIQLSITTEWCTDVCVRSMAFLIPPSRLQQECEIHYPRATFCTSTAQIGLNRWTDRQTDRQTDRHSLTDRQTDRQTDRHPKKERKEERKKERKKEPY